MATYKFRITGIDCAACAAKLEEKIKEIRGINNVSLSFMNETLVYDCDAAESVKIEDKMRAIVKAEEESAAVSCADDHHHHHDHSSRHHEHEETATYIFEVKGIDCAACAAKLEEKIKGIEGLSNVSLSFMNGKLTYDCDHDAGRKMKEKVIQVIKQEEPDAEVTFLTHKHHDDHDNEEHYHEAEAPLPVNENNHTYTLSGIDCADCAAKLEAKIARLKGIADVRVSFMHETLTFTAEESDISRLEEEIRDLLKKEEPDAVLTKKQTAKADKEDDDEGRLILIRLIIGTIIFIASFFTSGTVQIVIEIIAYLVLGYDVLIKALRGIGKGQMFDEHFLMAVATLAAMYIGDFREAAGVMLFYQIGEYFQDRAVARSRKSIGALMNIRPDFACVERDGQWVNVEPENVETGEIIRVKPGEKVPLDGVVCKGASSLDTGSLTGESQPRDVDEGDEVISGSVNETGLLEIKVTKPYGESTVAKILELVENTSSRKASAENFITKFSRWYTPTVVIAAIVVALVTGIVTQNPSTGIARACAFLVISCPCALVISVPLSFFAGIGGLSSRGVLVKGANLIETLAKVRTVVTDKTGTLTSGTFLVEGSYPHNVSPASLLEEAAYAEAFSNHPIASGIKVSYGKEIDESRVSDVQEIAGRGIIVKLDGKRIAAGNIKLMADEKVAADPVDKPGTCVYIAKDGVYEGCLLLKDQLKADACEAISELRKEGKKCCLVSGDSQEVTDEAGKLLGVDAAYGGCLPQDKVDRVNALKKEGVTAFIGDGVNDAPVLAAADIGIAMGALGSDAAIEAADVVIMDDKPSKIALAINSASRILKVVNQNIYGAIFIKVVTLVLSAFGIANMWWAIFADTGVAMLCVLNAMRLLYIAQGR